MSDCGKQNFSWSLSIANAHLCCSVNNVVLFRSLSLSVVRPKAVHIGLKKKRKFLPPAYGVRGKVIFILGNVCLFTIPRNRLRLDRLCSGRCVSFGFPQEDFLVLDADLLFFDLFFIVLCSFSLSLLFSLCVNNSLIFIVTSVSAFDRMHMSMDTFNNVSRS